MVVIEGKNVTSDYEYSLVVLRYQQLIKSIGMLETTPLSLIRLKTYSYKPLTLYSRV